MSDAFWRRLSTIAGFFVLVGIFGLMIFAANIEIKDLDLWLHIGMGRHITQNHFHIPSVDILSNSIAGKPWVNHEWLFQVIVYWIFSLWGADGLIMMQVVIVTLTMLLLLFLGYNREKQLSSIFMLLLVSLVYQSRFTIRPDLYSLFFFALYIVILSFYLDRRWSVAVLFVIQILWSNVHGFFFFGPLFVVIGLLGEKLKRSAPLPWEWNQIGRLTDAEYERLKLVLAVVIAACFINPLTAEGALYPLRVFTQISGESRIFFEKIIELQKPLSWNTLFSVNEYPYYKLMILLSAVSFFFNRRKIDIGTFFFWLVFLLFSLGAVRNLIFFAFAAYLVFVTNALSISLRDIVPLRITDKKFLYLASIFVKGLLVVWLMQFFFALSQNGYFDFTTYERKSEFGGIAQRSYPSRAVDFLVENKVSGNFFNDFNSGAYLVGRCFPAIKVFIDGRTEVYGPKFFKYYQDLWEFDNADKFEEMLERFNITGALLNSVQQPIPKNVLNALYKSKEWVPVYFDDDAIIFLKDVPQNREIIRRHRIDLARWEAREMDLYRLGSMKVTPYPNINRAYTLESMALDQPAIAEAQAALKVAPHYNEPYKVMGKIYGRTKDFQKAFENFRIAVTLAPTDKGSRANLALAYYDLGQYQYAVEQYDKMIILWPEDPKAYLKLSKVYLKLKKYSRAMDNARKGYAMDPKAGDDIIALGDMLKDDGVYDKAREFYELTLNSASHKDDGYLKLGVVAMAQGDKSHAVELLNQGLKANPENKDIREKLKELGAGPTP